MPDFDWNNEDVVVVRNQDAIAVYTDNYGNIVIRQEGDQFDDDIVIECCSLESAEAVARAIMGEVSIRRGGTAPPAASKDPTAAERQRRHRERQRSSSAPTTDLLGKMREAG